MSSTLAGAAAAALAAVFYNTGLAVQTFDAREAPSDRAFRLSLLGNLLRRPRWLLGTGLTVLGWICEVVAMRLAPLNIVVPMLALGLVVLLAIGARSLGESVGIREVVAVTAIVVGIAAVAALSTARSALDVPTSEVLLAMLIVAAIALVPLLVTSSGRPPWLPALSAGLLFALSVFATKLVADALEQQHALAVLGWATLVLSADIFGLVFEMSALQNYPATRTAPIVFSAQITVPVILGAVLTGTLGAAHERGGELGLLLGFCLVIAGAAALATSRLVAAAADPSENSESIVAGVRPAASADANVAANARDGSG